MLKYKMIFFLTLRCSPLDTQLMEDITILLLQEITQFTSYTYSIEKDETPDRHLHLLVKSDHRDVTHFKQILKKKKFEPFMKLLNNKNVETNQHALDIKMIKEEEYFNVLGYVYKETFCKRRYSTETQETITNAITQYHATKRLEQQNIPYTKKIILTTKNFHSHIEQFLLNNPEESVDDWYNMKIKMIMNNYSFFDISDKKVKIAIRELQMIKNPEQAEILIDSMELEDLQSKWYKNPEYDPDFIRTNFPENLKDAEYEISKWRKENKHKTSYWID